MRPGTGGSLARKVWLRPLAVLAAAVVCHGCGEGPVGPTPPGPPLLTCPANVTVSGVLGGSQPVTYPSPTAAGGAPPVMTACLPQSGSPFATGVTGVTCTATDAMNRQASCAFTVTLAPLLLGVHRFVAFGDSVTAGEDGRRLFLIGFVDPLRSYPALLQNILAADFPGQGATVVNAGVGGVKAKDDVGRLAGVIQASQAEAVLLLHGYNDLLNDGLSGVDDVVTALRDNVRTARQQGIQHVFVSTLTPSRPATGRFNRAIDPRAILDANAGLTQLAQAEGAVLVDAFGAFAGRELELIEEDGLHLTVAGNQVLAETFYAAIRAAGIAALRR